ALDLTRVGVSGHSWGGAAAARAILEYPDFFKVAVCSSGVHDLRIAQGWFAESVVGLSDSASEQATNLHLAERLEGNLLLAHGGADFWTHPAHTLRLAQKLVDAGKDFDLVLLPDRGHDVPSSTHFRRRAWAYFLRHLGPPAPSPSGVQSRFPSNQLRNRPQHSIGDLPELHSVPEWAPSRPRPTAPLVPVADSFTRPYTYESEVSQ
ncbi:MAG: S9 family peptidase, partial [Holophagales bacterium]|nr:S9 family peptidase [Holophagales bacterium]